MCFERLLVRTRVIQGRQGNCRGEAERCVVFWGRRRAEFCSASHSQLLVSLVLGTFAADAALAGGLVGLGLGP